MSNPAQPNPTHTRHPGWCSPTRCHSYDGGIDHHSHPIQLTFADLRWDSELVRPNTDVPARPAEAELQMSISVPEEQATLVTDADGGMTITVSFTMFMDEAQTLTEHVTEQRFRAQFLDSPVIHKAVP